MGQEIAVGYAEQYPALYQFLVQEICMWQDAANEIAISLLAVDDGVLSELCQCIEQHGLAHRNYV